MRITNSMMIDNLLSNLNSSMRRVGKYNDQLASNRRIVNLSDDPVGVLSSMNARQQIRRLEQYQRNVTSAKSWITQAETAITDMEEIVISLKELVSSAMGTSNESDKQNIATQVNELMEHLLQTSNAVVGDKYIFGGFNTSSAPFKAIRDEAGKIVNVLYNGYDLSQKTDAVLAEKKIDNTTNASDFTWTGTMDAPRQKYKISAVGDTLSFTSTDANGNNTVVTHQITAAEVAAGSIDLTADGFGKITWTNKADPTTILPDEIAAAIATADTITTQDTAVMGPKADSHLQWTGAIGKNEKYSISVSGDTLKFYNSLGSEIATKQLTAADIASGSIDMSAQGLGTVSWSTTNDPAADPPYTVPTTPEELASLIGTAGFVTSKIGEEATQRVQFEIGYALKQDVSFTGIDIVGQGDNSMFKVITNLINDLNNNVPNDVLTKHLSALTGVQDRLLTGLVASGTRTSQLETIENRYSIDAINYEAIRSDVEDIDQAKTILDFKYCESIFKQALASGAQIIQPTLMDFLR